MADEELPPLPPVPTYIPPPVVVDLMPPRLDAGSPFGDRLDELERIVDELKARVEALEAK